MLCWEIDLRCYQPEFRLELEQSAKFARAVFADILMKTAAMLVLFDTVNNSSAG